MQRVSIIQREIPHYRVRFFEELYAQGRLQDLDIHVYCAVPPAQGTPCSFPYRVLAVRHIGAGRQSAYRLLDLEKVIAGSDVVVAPQELQCLTVLALWAKRKRVCKTWIWWGHGYNFQAAVRPSIMMRIKETIKEFVTRRADGLITYTEQGTEYWRKRGVPKNRVMPYYNTLDVEGLRKARAEISDLQRMELRQKLKLDGKRVLLFSGRLYAEKNVDFLLRAFAILKKARPDVALLIIGDGDERNGLQQLAKDLELPDVHFLGEIVSSKDTAAYFSLADLMVIPSLVGLVIVHGFALGLPLLTTNSPGHGPELEYLTENNGVITGHDPSRYAEAIRMLLSSPPWFEAMKCSALAQGDTLKLEYSVQRFVNGITQLSK